MANGKSGPLPQGIVPPLTTQPRREGRSCPTCEIGSGSHWRHAETKKRGGWAQKVLQQSGPSRSLDGQEEDLGRSFPVPLLKVRIT